MESLTKMRSYCADKYDELEVFALICCQRETLTKSHWSRFHCHEGGNNSIKHNACLFVVLASSFFFSKEMCHKKKCSILCLQTRRHEFKFFDFALQFSIKLPSSLRVPVYCWWEGRVGGPGGCITVLKDINVTTHHHSRERQRPPCELSTSASS